MLPRNRHQIDTKQRSLPETRLNSKCAAKEHEKRDTAEFDAREPLGCGRDFSVASRETRSLPTRSVISPFFQVASNCLCTHSASAVLPSSFKSAASRGSVHTTE